MYASSHASWNRYGANFNIVCVQLKLEIYLLEMQLKQFSEHIRDHCFLLVFKTLILQIGVAEHISCGAVVSTYVCTYDYNMLTSFLELVLNINE